MRRKMQTNVTVIWYVLIMFRYHYIIFRLIHATLFWSRFWYSSSFFLFCLKNCKSHTRGRVYFDLERNLPLSMIWMKWSLL